MATVFALHGADAPAAFETIFYDPASEVRLDPLVLLVLALVSVVPFMLINARSRSCSTAGMRSMR